MFSEDVLLRVMISADFHDPGGSNAATKRMGAGSSGERTPHAPHAGEPAGATPRKEVSQESEVIMPSCMAATKRLIQKACFCEDVLEVIAADARKTTTYLYQGRWSRILYFWFGRNISPCKATVHQIAQFFLYFLKELRFSVPAIKGHSAAFSHVCLSRHRSGC